MSGIIPEFRMRVNLSETAKGKVQRELTVESTKEKVTFGENSKDVADVKNLTLVQFAWQKWEEIKKEAPEGTKFAGDGEA